VTCLKVPFEGRDVTAPHLGGKTSMWDASRHVEAKLIKYQHLHIIETTVSIPTKFCTLINTAKYSSWVVQADGRHFEKLKIRHISAMV